MLKVLLAGTFQTQTGYGKHFRNLCKVLKESFDISIYSATISVLPKAILKEEEVNLLNNRKVSSSKFDVAIFNTIPPLFPALKKQIKADCYLGYTVIEGRGRVLPDWAEASRNLDLLVVPSHYSSRPFEAAGLKPRIVPLGVDLKIFKANSKRKETPFRFITNFDWTVRFRKGFDILLQAYFLAFRGNRRVELILKTIAEKKQVEKLVSKAWKILGLSSEEVPVVKACLNSISEEALANLYQESDCFVLPSRAEGFCLPALEAMACGLPCIITEIGGHREFVNEENGYLVKMESEELPRNEHFYKYLLWHQCDWRILANLMLEAFRDRNKLKRKSALARETASQFSWERMGDSLRLLIEEVYYGKTGSHRSSSEKAAHSAYR